MTAELGSSCLGSWLAGGGGVGGDIRSYVLILSCSREIWSVDVSVSHLVYLLIEELRKISQRECLE